MTWNFYQSAWTSARRLQARACASPSPSSWAASPFPLKSGRSPTLEITEEKNLKKEKRKKKDSLLNIKRNQGRKEEFPRRKLWIASYEAEIAAEETPNQHKYLSGTNVKWCWTLATGWRYTRVKHISVHCYHLLKNFYAHLKRSRKKCLLQRCLRGKNRKRKTLVLNTLTLTENTCVKHACRWHWCWMLVLQGLLPVHKLLWPSGQCHLRLSCGNMHIVLIK